MQKSVAADWALRSHTHQRSQPTNSNSNPNASISIINCLRANTTHLKQSPVERVKLQFLRMFDAQQHTSSSSVCRTHTKYRRAYATLGARWCDLKINIRRSSATATPIVTVYARARSPRIVFCAVFFVFAVAIIGVRQPGCHILRLLCVPLGCRSH